MRPTDLARALDSPIVIDNLDFLISSIVVASVLHCSAIDHLLHK